MLISVHPQTGKEPSSYQRTPIEVSMAQLLTQLQFSFEEQIGIGWATWLSCQSLFPCRWLSTAWDLYTEKNAPGYFCQYSARGRDWTPDGCRWFKQFSNYRYVLDFAIQEENWKLAIECDGEAYHQDLGRERERDYYLKNQGWMVLHFPGSEICNALEQVGEKIKRVIETLKTS